MAEANEQMLAELLAEVETDNEAVQDTARSDAGRGQAGRESGQAAAAPPEVDVPECFQVVIECDDEEQQQEVYERMKGEGFKCRLLTL